jgi:hypothetical protein
VTRRHVGEGYHVWSLSVCSLRAAIRLNFQKDMVRLNSVDAREVERC